MHDAKPRHVALLLKTWSHLCMGVPAENLSSHLKVLKDQGEGRAYIVLFDEHSYEPLAVGTAAALAKAARSVLVKSVTITDVNWEEISASLQNLLHQIGVRQASFVTFGSASTIVQDLCLREAKIVRSMALIDGSYRPHPGWFSKVSDFIEEKLPLGLPLRAPARGLDSRAVLQRLRCPLLVVTSARAGQIMLSDAAEVVNRSPTAWSIHLTSTPDHADREIEELCEAITAFQQVPAKCPQKNT